MQRRGTNNFKNNKKGQLPLVNIMWKSTSQRKPQICQYPLLHAYRYGQNHPYSLDQLQNKQIILPEKVDYFPSQENLRWHRENIFKN
jgi:hypothetical protein